MADKFNDHIKLEPKELAKHLRQPDGETGEQVANLMNKSNKHICLNTYKLLAPQNNAVILEIGMGNGYYVADLLALASGCRYVGLDYSETMVNAARALNETLIQRGQVDFIHGSISDLPFDAESFDAFCTTNTIYFWPDPLANAQALFNVLKPNGKVCIAYRPEALMKTLEIAKYGFKTYSVEDVEVLLKQAGFTNISTQELQEPALDFDGTIVEMIGAYTIGHKA